MSDALSLPLLTITELCKTFGGVKAVRGVSFDIRPGQLVALIGTNGAGKTTLFNCINGQLKPDSGKVVYNSAALSTKERLACEKGGSGFFRPQEAQDITAWSSRRIAGLGIGRTFQITATFASMSVLENVQMAMIACGGLWKKLYGSIAGVHKPRALELLSLVGLEAEALKHTAKLAYGDLKRLELAMALARNPKLLLMDEPTAGMGAEERDMLMRFTQKIAQENDIGVLFTEHDMEAVFNYADWIIVMHRGEVIACGLPQEIRSNLNVKSAYFGEEGKSS